MSRDPKDFVPINIDSFIASSRAPSDLYLRIAGKMIKVIREGDSFDLQRLKTYEGHSMTHIYIPTKDFGMVTSHSITLMKAAETRPNLSQAVKLQFMRQAAENITRNLLYGEIKESDLTLAKEFLNQTVDSLQNTPEVGAILNMLHQMNEQFSRHTTAVSIFAIIVARNSGWKSKGTILTLATAGLLHDIGYKEVNMELFSKERPEMTNDEIREYESHPLRGAELLGRCRNISSDVVQIVLHHHELPNGYGFPNKLKGPAITPAARIIHLCDRLAHLVFPTSGLPPKSLKEACQFIVQTQSHDYSNVLMDVLEGLAHNNS